MELAAAAKRHTIRQRRDCLSAAAAADATAGCCCEGGGGRCSGGDASAALNCLNAALCMSSWGSARRNMTLRMLRAAKGDTLVTPLVCG